MNIVVCAIATTLALTAFGPGIPPLPAGEQPAGEDRDRVMERIEMMRMWRMTEDLELTEEEGAALFPALREIERERKGLNRERGEIMRELRATLRGEHPDVDTIQRLLDRLERNRESGRRLDDRETGRVKSLLDPERVARYIVFQRDFEREIREIILQSRRPGARRDVPERRPGRAFDRPPPVDRPPR